MAESGKRRTISSGRLPEQAPVDAYRGRSVDEMLLMAVFGKPALDSRFRAALRDLCSPGWERSQIHVFWEKLFRDHPTARESIVLIGSTQPENKHDDPEFRELTETIKRKFLPELFPSWDLADVLACATFSRSRTTGDEAMDRQFMGSKITDPIRYWVIRCYGELFEQLERPPGGRELDEHYPGVVGRFPNTRKPLEETGESYAPGQENLRKLIGQLDLWMIDQKFIDAVVNAHEKLRRRGIAVSGRSLWEQLTPKRRNRESVGRWNVVDFWRRLEVLAGLFLPRNPTEIPLLSAWLLWRRMRETEINTPLVNLRSLIDGLQDSLPCEVIFSLSLTHNQLADLGTGTPLSVEDLCFRNPLFSDLVADIHHALVARIAASRGLESAI